MPRTEDQFEKMRNETREKIRLAAISLFARRGLEATSVEGIAEAAGISTGLLYRHYKSKDDLFVEIANDSREGLAQMRASFDAGEPTDALARTSEEVARELREDTPFCEVMILITRALLMGDPRLAPLIEEDARMLDSLAHLIARGQAAGEFRSGDARGMACAYISTIQGAFILKSALGGAFTPPDAGTLLHMVTGRGDA